MCDCQHIGADDHHDAVEYDEEHLVIGEIPFEAFAEFGDTERAAD